MQTYLEKAHANYNEANLIYKDMRDDPIYLPYAGFWISQAVEMAMLHLFDTAGADLPKTHDIDQIVRIAREKDIDLFLTRYIAEHAEMFTLWVDRKDDVEYEIEKEKVECAIKGVEEYFSFIDLGLRFGQVFTSDLRHEKAARAAVEAVKKSDFRINIKRVILYGSCARNDQNHWSDVDVGIITRPGLLDDERLQKEYFNLISEMQSKDWDAADVEPHIFYDEKWDDDTFKKSVRRDSKIIWENPDYKA